MDQGYREPVYTIGIVAKFLKVCPATLRIWEKKKLIKPTRLGKNRFYSKCDIDRLEYIKELIQKEGVNIKDVKAILSTTKCWKIKKCPVKDRETCAIFLKYGQA